ncbi:MAG: SDR family oxidoreductase [Fimbriimonadaceae bacterium]
MTRIAIVTGGAGSLGRAVAEKFSKAKYDVVITAVDEAEADRYDGPANAEVVNLNDFEAVCRFAAQFDSIDALVCAAGGFAMGSVADLDDEAMRTMFNINFRTAAFSLSAMAPRMKSGSAAVLIGSQSYSGAENMAAYAASKAAVVSLAKSASLDLKDKGIRVNAILPDIMDTQANREAMPKADFSKWAKPEEVADVLLWLCSEQARLVNGVALPISRA